MSQPTSPLDPVRKSVTVRLGRDQAFALFTARIHEWWPMTTHSIGRDKTTMVVFEQREGGRVYERTADGDEHDWGVVLTWAPPERFVMTWHPGQPTDKAQRVEVRFVTEGQGTRVDLTHDGWEAQGGQGADYRSAYEGGWIGVLERLVAHADGAG